MAAVCPNKNTPEWKALELRVGTFEAYRDFMENDGDIRDPEVVARKIDARTNDGSIVYQKQRTGRDGNFLAESEMNNLIKALAWKFGDEYGYRTEDNPDVNWKGKVEPPSEKNGGKRTVVINTALATLDTPIHEFGHIFLDMIKNENPRLYAELRRTVPKSKEGSVEIEAIKKYYPELKPHEVEEEAIVELMGRHGAGELEKNTGLFTVLQKVWENIVSYIKDIISEKNGKMIEAVAIKYNTPIEVLSQMLTIEDLKITAGLEVKEKAEQRVQDTKERLSDVQEALSILKAMHIDDPEQAGDPQSFVSYKVQSKVHAVTRETLPKLLRIKEGWDNMKDYVTGDSMMEDLDKIFEEVGKMSSQLTTLEKLEQLKAEGKYKQWFFIAKVEASFMNQTASTYDDYPGRQDEVAEMLTVSLQNHMEDIAYYTSDSVITKVLTQSNQTLSNLFSNITPSDFNIHAGTAEVMADVQKLWEEREARTQLELDEGGVLTETFSRFTLEFKDTKLGKSETDEISLRIKFNPDSRPSIYVDFSSTNWDFGDPVWITEFDSITAKKDDKVLFKPNRRSAATSGARIYERPHGKILDVTEEGVIIKLMRFADWQAKDYEGSFEVIDARKGIYKVDPKILNSAVNQTGRMVKVMAKVMDEIGRLGYGFNYEYITFAAAGSQWGGKGRMRHGVYQAAAERMFGNNFVLMSSQGEFLSYETLENEAREKWVAEGKPADKFRFSVARQVKEGSLNNVEYDLNTIVFPKSFREGLFVQKEVYQKTRPTTSEIPLDSEAQDALIGAAMAQDPITDKSLSPESNNKVRAIEIAKKLSLQLGIEFEMISSEQAMRITENSSNPWNGQPAFFVGGRVYFVGDKLDTDTVLHEFAHPLLRHINTNHPELFEKLYQQLNKTEEGTKLIQKVMEKYPDLDPASQMFQEEVLAHALAEAHAQQIDDLKGESGFAKFIKEMLYAIKQMLRGQFGQNINISTLNPFTSMNSLAEILAKGGKFNIETEHINQEDVVAYMQDNTEYIDDLMNVKGGEIQALLNKAYSASSHQLDTLLRQKKYAELADLLTDQYDRGDLQEIKRGTSAFQSAVTNATKEVKDTQEHLRNQASSLVNVIFRLETIMDKINRHVQDLKEDPEADTIDNLKKLNYYESVVDYWQQFIGEAKEAINAEGANIPHDSPIVQAINSIGTLGERFDTMKDEIYAAGARDALYNELEPMGRDLKKRYETIIANLKEKNAPQRVIDKWFNEYYGMDEKEYNELAVLRKAYRAGNLKPSQQTRYDSLMLKNARGIEISPEKIEGLLKGQMGDANFFNSYLEGYLYNTDPVIGGLALYTKNKLNEVMVTAQQKFQDFKGDMQPLMDAIGVNPHNIGKFGEMMGFKDLVGKFNPETGEIEERNVWTLLNKFKGHRLDLSRAKDAVDKAQLDYSASGSDQDKRILIDAVAKRKQLLRDYFHQEYVTEFYDRDKALVQGDDDVVGNEAAYVRDNIFERMNALTDNAKTESDNLVIGPQLDALWSEYRQLHSLYYPDGTAKIDDPSNGKFDKSVAQRLRRYREESRKYYEWRLRAGVFENALKNYEQELIESGIVNEDGEEGGAFDVARQAWIDKNTRTVTKQEFYEYRQRLLDKIAKIQSKLPDAAKKEIDQTGSWEKILDLTSPFKDDDGQTKGTEMSTASLAQLKKAEEEIQKMRRNYRTRSGITPVQSARLAEIHKKDEADVTQQDRDEMFAIYAEKKKFGLSETEIVALDALYEELGNISSREATAYYTDIMNGWLSLLDTTYMHSQYNTHEITAESADALLEPRIIDSLLGQNAEFDKWFTANHIQKDFFDENATPPAMAVKWARTYAWSVVKPTNQEFMETTEIVNSKGEAETIAGLPGLKYYVRVVAPEFRTERIVGETVDNQGNWLPKTVEQGAKDGKYRNQEYYDMASNEPDKFAALQMLTKHHLANQEGLSYKNRLGMDFPRFRKSNLEALQTRNVAGEKMNAISLWAKRVRDFWTGAKDDAEAGLNYNEEFNLVRADMFDNEITSVPIGGLYDIDFQDISTDITHTMMRYMLSAERQKQLVEISPIAQAIKKVVNDPKHDVKDLTKKHRFNLIHRGITTYMDKKGIKVRRNAVNNFMEREFEGKVLTGAGSETAWLNNVAGKLFGRASFGFFALNIPSALKNSFGAKFQGMIEAAAGKYMNARSFAAGDILAGKTMVEISSQVYRRTHKSLNIQMIEIFDPSQGRFEDPNKFGEDLSRTISKDTASLSWLYNFRKWVELQATFQIFFGMMKFQEIEMEDGTKIKYDEAWEVVDGKIQLKEGVPAEWGITYNEEGEMQLGAEFKRFKNKMQQVMNNLQGAYAKFDQPEAQRYLAFRFLSYLRRYFTTMTMNRWGYSGKFWNAKPRLNPGLGDVQRGFYVTFLNSVKDTVTTLGRNIPYMEKDEKVAAIKTITESVSLVMLTILMSTLFGWDPDDEDRFKKLRGKSGALPFPFVSDQKGREFDGWGFLENHALLLFMNIQAENEQFLPLPGAGLDDYSAMLDLKSIAFGPTVQTYRQIIEDLVDIVGGDERAYYKRDVGPYEWQREGGAKIWAHLGRTIGTTGGSLDPAKAIKGLTASQSRAR